MEKNKGYLTWNEDDDAAKALALRQVHKAIKEVQPVIRATGSDIKAIGSDIFLNVSPSMSVKDGFTRSDYDAFRPDESTPCKPKDIIAECMRAYKRVGLVRNVIDLMSDFGVQGIDICHPNERVEQFYKNWFKIVRGRDRSERFLNTFYRTGNVIIYRESGKCTASDIEKLKRTQAAIEEDLRFSELYPEKPPKGVVPARYHILNPLQVEVLEDEFSGLTGSTGAQYVLKLPAKKLNAIKTPGTPLQRERARSVPDWIRKAVQSGQTFIPLDPKKTITFFYKKDDWQSWAEPMLLPVLTDLKMLEKMKLADVAALDGAISNIRIWKLGNIENRIVPGPAIFQKLAEALANNVGGGVMDLVWGPDLELVETSTDIHHFLGHTKYGPVWSAIYEGLGVPPSLTGQTKEGGFTNNFLSLKTLIERLQYGREALIEFWENEIRLVQLAMGFRVPAYLTFDRMTLNDETSEKKLLLDMADRNLISDESIQEQFGLTPEIETVRIRREGRKRVGKLKPEKASPFHKPDHEKDIHKILAQTGAYSAEELGLEMATEKGTKKVPHQVTKPPAPKPGLAPTPPGSPKPKKSPPQGGRPNQSTDKFKRKRKEVKPQKPRNLTRALRLAQDKWEHIHRYVGPCLSSSVLAKGNHCENYLGLLCLLPFDFSQSEIQTALTEVQSEQTNTPREIYRQSLFSWSQINQVEPELISAEVKQQLALLVYAALTRTQETEENEDGYCEFTV